MHDQVGKLQTCEAKGRQTEHLSHTLALDSSVQDPSSETLICELLCHCKHTKGFENKTEKSFDWESFQSGHCKLDLGKKRYSSRMGKGERDVAHNDVEECKKSMYHGKRT